MALRAVKPSTIEKRLKALFYGTEGVGKTTAAISFPKPYLIDTEKGASNDQYVELLEKSGGVILICKDFDELLDEIKSLLSEKHAYQTLIIDSLTNIYDGLLEKAANKVGTEFGRHYGEANKSMKHLLNLLLRLDMNVIITSHSKNEYGDNLKVLGSTYDCYKKLGYLFDLIVEIQQRGNQRIGIIKKSRISSLPNGDQFPFSYDSIADKYGRSILERDAVPVELATFEQIKELTGLIDLLKIPSEVYQKWLDKAEAANFEEMSTDFIKKCVDALKKKLTTKGE